MRKQRESATIIPNRKTEELNSVDFKTTDPTNNRGGGKGGRLRLPEKKSEKPQAQLEKGKKRMCWYTKSATGYFTSHKKKGDKSSSMQKKNTTLFVAVMVSSWLTAID